MNKKKFKVLFICTGNCCRSPMAKGILNNYLQKNKIENIEVDSAGIMAPAESPPSNYTIMVTVENGIDISSHRSKLVNREIVESSDIILVMEQSHKDYISKFFPFCKKKVYLLKNFGDTAKGGEIDDPIGFELDTYRICYQELKKEIYRIILELIKITGKD